ncbi:MAG: SDR family NAD(P)-dependent oxidoreductase [Deltaproteobacteria bacterium]|nr:SDR family NAD(P)-dependent oxidoreductase [Deltaproteobacteria bacterium]
MSDSSSPSMSPGEASLSPTKRALKALQEMQGRLDEFEARRSEPIAIVGMGYRFPGADSVAAYWQLLTEGADAISEVPAHRWDIHRLYHPDPDARGKISGRWGGFLEGLDRFDTSFFGISPREAPYIDPRQRLLLEIAWEALENAGIPPESLAGSSTGVYTAVLTNDYDQMISRRPEAIEMYTGTGTANAMVANRLSYFLDLQGPSMTLDTACSGSLLAIHLACQGLRGGEADLALAGGVALNLLPNGDLFFSRAESLSTAGRCRAFDKDANGIVRSEGAGLVVLKRLSQAQRDGDRIYAQIAGGATNHDGRSNGIMAPRGEAQEAVLRRAYQSCGQDPARVQYIEAHGTGTRVGDPIEVRALSEVLGQGRGEQEPLHLGSVKTNLGHMESAAGVAGVMKVALALHHRQLPGNLHFRELNPLIDSTTFPLRVEGQLGPWPDPSEPLLAGVNGFGFGGTNVHLVLQEATGTGIGIDPAQASRSDLESHRSRLLPLSARSPEGLKQLAQSWRRYLTEDLAKGLPEDHFYDLGYTAACRRSHLEYRLAVAAADREELDRRLEAFLEGEDGEAGVIHGQVSGAASCPVVFAFSGQGGQWLGMGLQLLEEEPVFRRCLEECDRLLGEHLEWSLLAELGRSPAESRLEAIEVAQPVIFSFQVALAALWRSWGIEPTVVFGQSLGEVAAAHVSGALSLEDAVLVVVTRSQLLRRVAGKGATAAVGLPPEEVQELLVGREEEMAMAGSTGPTSCIVSGDPAAVRELVATLEDRDVYCRLLERVDAAAHSPHMDPLLPELAARLAYLNPQASEVPFLSTVTAEIAPGETLGASYWTRNLREPFHVARAVEKLIGDGQQVFLEVGPHPLLAGAIRQSLVHSSSPGKAIGSLRRDEAERESLLTALGELYTQGLEVDWQRQYPEQGSVLELPTYPWQRERHWLDEAQWQTGHPLLGSALHAAQPVGQILWQGEQTPQSQHYLSDHRLQDTVVFPAASYVEMALAASFETSIDSDRSNEDAVPVLTGLRFDKLLLLPGDSRRSTQVTLSPGGSGDREFTVHSRSSDDSKSEWLLHARGHLRLEGSIAGSPGAASARQEFASSNGSPTLPEPISARKAAFPQDIPVSDHYRAMAARGISYGESFQALREISRGDRQVLTRLELSPECASENHAYRLHPVLLDAAFQSVAAIFPPPEEGNLDPVTYLPRGIEQLRWTARPPAQVWCWARLKPGSEAGDQALEADIDLMDDSGAPLVTVEGLQLERLESSQTRSAHWQEQAYEPTWIPLDEPVRSEPSKGLSEPGRWIILADWGGFGGALASALESHGESCYLVRPGDCRGGRLEAGDAQIEPSCGEDFLWLMEQATAAANPTTSTTTSATTNAAKSAAPSSPLRGIISCWSLDLAASEDADANGLTAALRSSCGTALEALRALSAGPSGPRLWLVTRKGQPVTPGEADLSTIQSALWGLGKVIALEQEERWGGLVDLDTGPALQSARQMAAELLGDSSERQIAFRDGQRYAARLQRYEQPAHPLSAVADGAYLITGGLSGLGLETARWLAQAGARRLILLGRTALPPRRQWTALETNHPAYERVAAVRDLERQGMSIHLGSFDIADPEALTAFLADYRSQGWPPIRGVVHSAGLVQDQLAVHLDDEAFQAATRPKVLGSWLLHRATLEEPLDFFLLYSSMTSLFGQLGQGAYAAGNAFMDALAHARRARGLPALSIHWGPWSEVGIYARLDEATRRGIDMSGVHPISPEDNLRVLGQVLGSETPEILVADADWNHLASGGGSTSGEGSYFSLLQEEAGEQDGDQEGTETVLRLLLAEPAERRALLLQELRSAAARVLRTEADRLAVQAPLTTLGLDSIMAVELKNTIHAQLDLQVAIVDLFTASISGLVDILLPQLDEHQRLTELLEEIEGLSLEEAAELLEEDEETPAQDAPEIFREHAPEPAGEGLPQPVAGHR